jgi:RNA polymerase sigma factor (sigma-70 family)
MRYLVNSLARHEVYVARYYMKRGAYLAAANRAQAAITNYPEAPAIEEALFVRGVSHEPLDDQQPAIAPGRDLVALDDALRALAVIDERKSQVVEMRFFGGLSNEETADVLGVSAKTVMREWQLAKVWLLRELT